MNTLARELETRTREAELYEPLPGAKVRCFACGLNCTIFDGFPGVCKVRFNRGGKLYAPFGYVNAIHCDPIEKKPFFHFLPGSLAMSFGMLGCDLHCPYCQNWLSSQALRDPQASLDFQDVDPDGIVRLALRHSAASIVSTYNEPLITSEWAVEIFRHARRCGLLTGYVSNGNATPRVLEYLRPWLDAYKVDLKCFSEAGYRRLGGRLAPVLDSIQRIHAMGFWIEVVTLLVPGFNDSPSELRSLAQFLAGVSPDIPWHLTAFHKDYKMTEPENTSVTQLLQAVSIGRDAGLRYVYAGNLPGSVGDLEDTRCPGCGSLLIRRIGFRVLRNRIGASGACPDCGASIPGVWSRAAARAQPADALPRTGGASRENP